jgi:shikimate dehydrogenase
MLGAAMHNAGYHALGLSFTYVPFQGTDLAEAIHGMRALGLRGLEVAPPFTRDVIPLLDSIDPLAQKIGAVDTVVNDGGHLVGYNTDAFGAGDALGEVTIVAGRRVLIIGAGPAACAVAHVLANWGPRLHVVHHQPAAAAALARSLGPGATAGGLDDLARLLDFDILVHCPEAGTAVPPGMAVLESRLRPGLVVMDLVCEPMPTELVMAATRRGARVVHGRQVLLNKAFRQFELYTGRPAPRTAMEAALAAHLPG